MDGNIIKSFRKNLGLSQMELGKRLGVTYVTVNRWENGKSKPSSLAIAALKNLMGEKQ